MTLGEILDCLLIGPLKSIFELVFSLAYTVIGQPGFAIVVLSLVMNVLLLPLYRRADAIQIEARDTENRLKPVVDHIKKTFSGDERMMILQTYYRQNNYSPLSVLSGSISLLLEIPFFMAAYQFLSGVEAFVGTSFGPIADLSRPDGLLVLGSVTVNVLPLVMTAVNVISSSLYLKGFPLKTKIQLYGMALAFLVLLYNSPSAMVFYWTLNNLFSLVKTLFYRMKDSRKALNILLGVFGVACVVAAVVLAGFWRSSLLTVVGLAAQLPWVLPLVKKKLPAKKPNAPAPSKKTFVSCALFLTALVGLLIPATYISASPQEYIVAGYFYAPLWYVLRTLCLTAGTFLVWMSVFYWLSAPKGRVIFERVLQIACVVMAVNYLCFGTQLGVLSPNLQYTDGFQFAVWEHIVNIVVVIGLAVGLYLAGKKWPKVLPRVLLIGTLALAVMGGIHVVRTAVVTEQTRASLNESENRMPSFSLSKEGKNVVVIMLDRGLAPFVPYIMEENETLRQQFDGFTNYANTMSYGAFTNVGTPPLYGGYDYTPVNMNLRDTEPLADKHNEALKVMPALFSQEGYEVTLIDPSYAGYKWIPDVSIFDDMEGVSAYRADGKFNDYESRVRVVASRKRNFFYFSLMKTLPVSLQTVLYDNGHYRAVEERYAADSTGGVNPGYMSAYWVLENLDTMTRISDEGDTYMFLRSNATHEPVVLQEPDFKPVSYVDNSASYTEGRTISDGTTTHVLTEELDIAHYHVNMASLMQLGEWFDYLREQGVYDNTRIIVVSDHGRNLGIFDDDPQYLHMIEFYEAMLLVKDFDAHGFTTAETFMTNADVPTLATDGLIENPVNPFTGNPIDSSFKTENERQYVFLSGLWDIENNNGNQFLPAEWASVTKDVRDKSNWIYYSGESVLPPME